jgi:hypothetical protein
MMSKSTHRLGIGLGALLAGSVLTIAPLAASADGAHPARVCFDNGGPIGNCDDASPTTIPGSDGQDVTLRPVPTGRLDAKDHPNYGQITPETPGRLDAKDHPNYGQITPQAPGRLDAKDHPNYNPSDYAPPAVSAPGGGGGVVVRSYTHLLAV